MEVRTVVLKAAEYVGALVVLGTVFLTIGSMWIDREVERRMNELAIDPSASPAVVTLQADVANIKETHGAALNRVETKVDAFSDRFIAYLEAEANR